MAKRFTDTDIWKTQRWFRKLVPEYKLAFCYIKDTCNHAGLWKVDCSDLIEDLGLSEFDFPLFIETVNIEFDKVSGKKINKERIRLVEKNYLWLTGFIQFQYEGKDRLVNHFAAPVRTALLFLSSLNLLDESLNKKYITLKEPLQEGWQTPKDKDRVKDKEKDSKEISQENKRAIKIDEKTLEAVFSDGHRQKLGFGQKGMLEIGELKPKDVYRGLSN